MLASLPVEAEQDGTLLVNANPLLLRDAFDLLSQLRHPFRAVGGRVIRGQSSDNASWRLDYRAQHHRSRLHRAPSRLNTEVEALLTFTSEGESDLNQPDPHTVQRARASLLCRIAGSGLHGRVSKTSVSVSSARVFRISRNPTIAPSIATLISRWRLEKKDPNAALSEPVKPLVFYHRPRDSRTHSISRPSRHSLVECGLRTSRIQRRHSRGRFARGREPARHPLSLHSMDEPLGPRMVRRPKPRRSAHRRNHSLGRATRLAPHAHRQQLLASDHPIRQGQRRTRRSMRSPRFDNWIRRSATSRS